ncbi:MAG TPA: heavy metal-responsive transcriptional regulator [Terriglobales bacterium]|nr:heavy metal-responsive transcriptional regulator [Terriglobales bacterium]
MSQGLQIGKAAREAGLGIHAIRFYEREGLLKQPTRSEGGFRLFDQDAVRDLKFIRKAQGLGFSLSEIRELLVLRRTTSEGCSHVRDLLSQKLDAVRKKVAELEKLEGEIKAALQKCNRDLRRAPARVEKACPVLEELGRANGDEET